MFCQITVNVCDVPCVDVITDAVLCCWYQVLCRSVIGNIMLIVIADVMFTYDRWYHVYL